MEDREEISSHFPFLKKAFRQILVIYINSVL